MVADGQAGPDRTTTRRAVLSTIGSVALGGCTQLSGAPRTVTVTKTVIKTPEPTPTPSPSPSPTPTATPTPTEQPTPELPEPKIQMVALISDWTEFGDVMDNQITSITPDESALIGGRFEVACGPDREVRWRNFTTVRNEAGDAVGSESTESEEFTNNCTRYNRSTSWEQAVSLTYNNDVGAEWPIGTYTAPTSL